MFTRLIIIYCEAIGSNNELKIYNNYIYIIQYIIQYRNHNYIEQCFIVEVY